ncbi:terminase large subunit [Flavobacterium phage vB_FspS_tooticki9-1]|uniref:Terminase large subunit n=2 Tax=Muminvirus tooticki TaxID=2844301 RepID=A0A6B9LGC3_9CAUD|nr:terminase large subunit [Flavobacterium phage vB_FspS_tooticki6-1]QHB41037.1 terminase large subunit [Flavobacterium phage vB_FspS_tooticki6-1]QHB41102.1 terminase large subunit [Flavobacterium phage vB_FspS_tooticki9-1]
MQATTVFEKTYNAIKAKNTDGTRKYKYIIHTGSSRSSKTHSILQTHWLMCLENPNFRISIWRETKADCKMTILADLKKALPTLPYNDKVNFNKTESIFTFEDNATIEFMGGDEENRVHGFQGNVAHLNEPYKFSVDTFNQIDMRTSDYIIIDWNPKNNHWIEDVAKRENAIVIHSTYKDNPFIPLQQKIKIESYLPVKYTNVVQNELISVLNAFNYDFNTNQYKFTEKQITELKKALFNEQQGTANDYLHLVYAKGLKAEKPNKIYHNWKVIPDDEFDMLPFSTYYGMDFGLSSPSAMVQMKFDGDKTFFFKEILYKPLNHIEGTLSTELDNLKIPKHIEIICDVGNELNKTEMQKLRNAGYNVLPAMKGAGSILSGIETIQKSTIYYTKSSKNIENEYDTYSWRIAQGVQLDEPEQTDDHLLDAMKYVISWYRRTRYLS